tara:strand:+ start:895 stop:1569 length:675 start_codon:yes stop_codon:yes gene_type:complete
LKRALIISAHPDDDILGCGAIINKYKSEVEFKVVFIGEGSTCRFEDPESSEAQEEIKKRNNFAIEAFSVLGISNHSFNNLPCGRFDQVPLIEINKIIEREIKSFEPDTIFTHSKNDSNQDHVKVFRSTIIAARPGSGVKTIYSYEVLSSTEWGFDRAFNANIFFRISKNDLDKKIEAFAKYATETKPFPYPRSSEGILVLAKRRGMQSNSQYAEAFNLIRQTIE